MESNKAEAKRAMDIAEKKLSESDYIGAKKFIKKAQSLYPHLDGLKQVLMMINVFISASSKKEEEADWYSVLGVDPLASDEAVKKQYKKLALLLHPDKNKFNGAEEAFKLVLEAWSLLSDKAKRHAHDQKRKFKQVQPKNSWNHNKTPKPEEPDASSSSSYKPPDFSRFRPNPQPENVSTFWTKCDKCNTYCKFLSSTSLNKILPCPNCSQSFVATEIVPEMINGKPVFRFSSYIEPTTKNTQVKAQRMHMKE